MAPRELGVTQGEAAGPLGQWEQMQRTLPGECATNLPNGCRLLFGIHDSPPRLHLSDQCSSLLLSILGVWRQRASRGPLAPAGKAAVRPLDRQCI